MGRRRPAGDRFLYADGRGGEHATRHLDGFRGTLQVDGYAGYRSLTDPRRPGGPVTLAFCWAHCRRKFYEIAEAGHAPIAEEALKRTALAIVLEPCVDGSRGARTLFGGWVWSVAAMCTASDVQREGCAP